MERTRTKRGPRVALASLLATVVLGLTVSTAGADGVVVAGNPNCSLVPGTSELRVDPPQSGTFTDGTLTVTVTVRTLTSDDPQHPGNQTGSQVFDFTATGGTVLGVVVKGGPNANFYDYRPVGVTSGTALHAPVLGSNPKFAGLSHISFCYIVKASPTIVTQVSSASITIGGSVTDTATLSGGNNPTGTITFNAFGPNDADCSGTAAFTDTVTVSGNGDYTSGSFTPSAVGTYRWIASYSGDANNEAATTACNDPNESVVVTKNQPSLSTAPDLLPNDKATLSGLVNPSGGTITFELFLNADCSGTPAYTEPAQVVNADGNFFTSNSNVKITGDQTISWIVTYSGDASNEGASSACADEQVEMDFTPLAA